MQAREQRRESRRQGCGADARDNLHLTCTLQRHVTRTYQHAYPPGENTPPAPQHLSRVVHVRRGQERKIGARCWPVGHLGRQREEESEEHLSFIGIHTLRESEE